MTINRTPLTIDDLEFENGKLVKVRGKRHNYMDGDSLIWLVGELGRLLAEERQKNTKLTRKIEDDEEREYLNTYVYGDLEGF